MEQVEPNRVLLDVLPGAARDFDESFLSRNGRRVSPRRSFGGKYTSPGSNRIEDDAAKRHTLLTGISRSDFGGPRSGQQGGEVGEEGRAGEHLVAAGLAGRGEGVTVDVGAEVVSRESLDVARRYVQAALPGLDPEPVDELRCTDFESSFLDENGDGFTALRRDSITAFYGNNLFKFAPLLGELLSQSAMDGSLPAELAMFTVAR